MSGRLGLYDWEASLIGPERTIGGHPGRAPRARALSRAKREWRAAGRAVNRPPNPQLIRAGAFPTKYRAAKLASAQESDTVIVSEQPSNNRGETIAAARPGWYALRDNPALTGSDIVGARAETDEVGQPTVTFGFTSEGRVAFERVTRAIAQRGRDAVRGPVTDTQAERLSNHLALIFDGEVKTRPIINFVYNPDGIDGRTGAQIAGGFTNSQEAQDLAAILRTGALPNELNLIRQRPLPQNS